MIQNKPTSARERLLENIRFLLNYGPINEFDIAYNDLNFFQFYLLDVFTLFFIIFLIIIFIFIHSIIYLYRKISFIKIKKD